MVRRVAPNQVAVPARVERQLNCELGLSLHLSTSVVCVDRLGVHLRRHRHAKAFAVRESRFWFSFHDGRKSAPDPSLLSRYSFVYQALTKHDASKGGAHCAAHLFDGGAALPHAKSHRQLGSFAL